MSNSGRSRVREDRFYSPPAMRRYNQQQQKQVQQEEQKVQPPRHQEKQQQSESLLSSNISVVTTNLDRFMKHTTPIVTAQHFSKTSMKGWRDQDKYYNPYFILGDLWESLKEWSAYGAGVPLVLNESDSVVQYYVPYLSAIQLYVDPSAPVTSIRPGEESDSDSSRATSSDGSYEPGSVGLRPRVQENVGSIAESFNKLMLRSDPFAGDGIEEGEIRNPPGLLIFEYFERALPYHRAPLADKISDLASKFPELKTYRSCDLTQSSWVSVAWYPIYRIPVGPSLQNLDASFLTFHSLSTPSRSVDGAHGSSVIEVDDVWRILLPIFGLAVYKFKSSDWTQSGIHGTEKVNSLMQSTENWLRNLNVYHPDFMFFKNHEFWR
ncbi:uncharacterized protein LOC112520619 isoform X2 [Cynara cardunculus var. scolymus]|uniref:uncharacterized protein LOC112520619 isoform X2 n=1 Tax=Cynara cardunculus var. scolymus TaxID=59895 RepID=UPI000D6247B7|nr:uncharacterized protein LOC112520619 isoform X2 [Cynara cardunculus var. scolymus]